MTKIEAMYLADRIAGWYDNFAPFEPVEDSEYFFIQLSYKENREKLLELLRETAEGMDKASEDDQKSYDELCKIITEIEKI